MSAGLGVSIRRGTARAATRLWDASGPGAALLRLVLVPASLLYGASVLLRNGAYRVGVAPSRAIPARVVSIGNVRVGGTGKTPLTRWLAVEAHARGVRVAIISRG